MFSTAALHSHWKRCMGEIKASSRFRLDASSHPRYMQFMKPLVLQPGIPLRLPPGELCGIEAAGRPDVTKGADGEWFASRLLITSPRSAAWIKKTLGLKALTDGLVIVAGADPKQCLNSLFFVRCPEDGITPRTEKIYLAHSACGGVFVGLQPGAPGTWPDEVGPLLYRGCLFGFHDVARNGFTDVFLVTADPGVLAPEAAWRSCARKPSEMLPGYDLLHAAPIGERMWLKAQAPAAD